MGHIFELEQRYVKKYGALFNNYAYRETSTIFALQQTVDKTLTLVPGRHGVDAKSDTHNAIEIKSVNVVTPIYYKTDGEKYKGVLGRGHNLSNTSLVGKFDKIQSDQRFQRIMDYDAFAFSVFSNRHLPEVVFYINKPSAVSKIKERIKEKRINTLLNEDTSSYKGSTVDISFKEIFESLTDDEICIIIDQNYIDLTDDIKYVQVSKVDYIQNVIGSELPKGNIKRKS